MLCDRPTIHTYRLSRWPAPADLLRRHTIKPQLGFNYFAALKHAFKYWLDRIMVPSTGWLPLACVPEDCLVAFVRHNMIGNVSGDFLAYRHASETPGMPPLERGASLVPLGRVATLAG